MGEILDIDLFQQVDDCIYPVVSKIFKTDVEVPNNKGGAVYRARLPCHSEIVHPHRTVGGGVDPHDIEPLVAHDKLEGQSIITNI